MLKRNKVLVAFMLVAVLCMSIGFAAIADTLYVEGSMSLDLKDDSTLDSEFEEKIYFVKAMETNDDVTASEIVEDDDGDEKDKYTFTIDASAFAKTKDSVTVTVDIKNENTAAAALKVNTVSEGDLANYITVNATLADTTVKADGTTTLTITVTLDSIPKAPETGDTLSSTISFTIDATPAE